MNRTAKAKADRAAALRAAYAEGDKLAIALLEANLVDFDPQPVYVPEICSHCGTAKAAMVGCRCVWGDD
jgi:hypothetical protein